MHAELISEKVQTKKKMDMRPFINKWLIHISDYILTLYVTITKYLKIAQLLSDKQINRKLFTSFHIHIHRD